MTENARLEAQTVVLRTRCHRLLGFLANVQKARTLDGAKTWATIAMDTDVGFAYSDDALARAPASEESA